MPWPPVFCTVTYDSDADLPAPGETPMPMPEVFEPPSMVMGAAGSGAIAARSPPSWKPATLPMLGSLLAGRLTRIGPFCVAMVTFAGTMIGSVSVASSGTVWPLCPTMMICVPGTREAADHLQRVRHRAEAAARVRDAADHAAAGRGRVVAVHRIDVVLVARSRPSSRCSCCSRSGRPSPGRAQSASTQQLPGVHRPPQQKSPALAAQAPLVLQAALTHSPLSVWPVVVLQIVAEP